MLIFKKLSNAVKETNTKLAMYKDGSTDKEVEYRKQAALDELVKYTKSYAWMKRRDAIEKVQAVLKSKYDYKLVSEHFHVSSNSLQVTMSYASKLLEDKIGANTIDLILIGEIDNAMLQFRAGAGVVSLDALLVSGVTAMLPKTEKSLYLSVVGCEEELNFIRGLTVVKVAKELSGLDSSKLAFLRYILGSSDSRYARERGVVLNYISGNISNFADVVNFLALEDWEDISL